MSFYATVQAAARGAAHFLLGHVRVTGREHIPAEGPFLLVANHQSLIDAVVVQAFCPRELHTMTKSTQFATPGLDRLLVRLHAFPVRRFQVDPQAVRIALRRLGAGEAVGVYVEGERSWDGRLQAPRLGTLRLILKAGVPVVPCGVSGSYAVLPRWARRLHRSPVRIAFGPPLRFPVLDQRSEREALLARTGEQVMSAIRSLLESRS